MGVVVVAVASEIREVISERSSSKRAGIAAASDTDRQNLIFFDV